MARDAVEYDIFVPQFSGSGQIYKAELSESIKKEIIQFFGGLTDTRYRSEGVWKIGGVEIRDEIVIWRVVSEEGDRGDEYMQGLQKKLMESLQQDSILIVRRSISIL